MNIRNSLLLCTYLLLMLPPLHASEASSCLLNLAATSSADTTLGELEAQCLSLESNFTPTRILEEQQAESNKFVITPHHQNYILPFSYNDSPNQEPLEKQGTYQGIERPLENREAKLQISFKVALYDEDIFYPHDRVYFGFTMKSFWQVYNKELSAPFRETNYRPELFYQVPISSRALGGTWLARVGIEHESNGRSQLLSRSWNRLFLGLGFQKDRWALYLQPWYRLPENEKQEDNDPDTPVPPDGDDNPDITDFLGYYEFIGVYNAQGYELTSKILHNFETGNGSIEMGMSFPMWGRLKGFVQYFNGYGESLIDYDHKVQRLGVGLLLTDLL